MTYLPETNLTMLTLAKPEGELEVYLERRPMPTLSFGIRHQTEPTQVRSAAGAVRLGIPSVPPSAEVGRVCSPERCASPPDPLVGLRSRRPRGGRCAGR